MLGAQKCQPSERRKREKGRGCCPRMQQKALSNRSLRFPRSGRILHNAPKTETDQHFDLNVIAALRLLRRFWLRPATCGCRPKAEALETKKKTKKAKRTRSRVETSGWWGVCEISALRTFSQRLIHFPCSVGQAKATGSEDTNRFLFIRRRRPHRRCR